jgi:hypothetical protein
VEAHVEQTLTRVLEVEVRRLQDPMEFTEPAVKAARRKLKRLTQAIAQTKGTQPLAVRAQRLRAELQRLAPEQVPRQPQRGRPGGSDAVYAYPRPRDAESGLSPPLPRFRQPPKDQSLHQTQAVHRACTAVGCWCGGSPRLAAGARRGR